MILQEAGAAPPPVMPLAAFAEHLRLAHGFADQGSEDASLETYLRNALAVAERFLGQALIRRRFSLRVSRWGRSGHLVMPLGPVVSVESVSLTSAAGTVALAPGAWTLEAAAMRPRLMGPGGAGLPPIPPGGEVEIVFEAGHGADWDGLPRDLAQAVMMLAAHYYEHRSAAEPGEEGLPHGVIALLERHRPVRL